MTEFKPCPFCGGEAEMLTAESMNGGYLFGIMCNDCRSRGDVYDTEAEAIEAWNTRHVGTGTCTIECNERGCNFAYRCCVIRDQCGYDLDKCVMYDRDKLLEWLRGDAE